MPGGVCLILQVVVLVEFGGMGDLRELCALCTLGLNEVAQQFLGEDTAYGQVIVVSFQGIQSILQADGQTLQLCLLLIGQMVQVKVVVASGLRSSKRRSSGDFAYAGMRMTALRLEVA